MRISKRTAGRAAAIRTGALILILTFFIASMLSCRGGPEKTESESASSKYGGVLYFGVENGFIGFDVFGAASSGLLIPSMSTLNNLIQEPLFRMGRDGNLIPALGLSASPSEKMDSWDIALREGVLFHDGTAFNADAVVFHWARLLNPDNKYPGRKLFQPIQKVEKIDDYSVRFTLAHPWPPFLKFLSDELYLAVFIPSPKAVKEGIHDMKPVGTGPFKYGKRSSWDHFVVHENENYWQKDTPYLNKVVFRCIHDNQARYASLMAGQLDMIVTDRGALIRKAKEDPSLHLHASQGNGAEIVIINHKPPLDDVRVRRALALANKQELHISMIYGDAIPYIHHPMGDGLQCEDDGYPEHDPEEARRLLAEYGKPVEIECISSNTSRGRSIGELLQQLYKDVGVIMKPVPLSTLPHLMNVKKKEYHLATWRFLGSKDMGPLFHRFFHSGSPTNFTGYNSPEMDELLEAQRGEPDPEKRNGLLCKIVKKINEDALFLYRGGRRRTIISRKKIRDITDVSGIKVNLSTAWIDENVKFNMLAFDIEQKADLPIECPDPGDVAAVKKLIIGQWKGKDSWGAAICLDFHSNDMVTAQRTKRGSGKVKYLICGSKIYFKTTALVELTVAGDKMEGTWENSKFKGEIILEREKTSS